MKYTVSFIVLYGDNADLSNQAFVPFEVSPDASYEDVLEAAENARREYSFGIDEGYCLVGSEVLAGEVRPLAPSDFGR